MDETEKKKKRTRAYVEEVYRQIQEKPDITDIMILNSKGNPIKTTMQMNVAIQHAGSYEILRNKAIFALQKIEPIDELRMLRIRTTQHEIFIVPDGKITAVVFQEPIDRFTS